MKAKIVPIYFPGYKDEEFEGQIKSLEGLVGEEAEFLSPIELGAEIPEDCDGVLFPALMGVAYRSLDKFKAINKPIMIVTSEFGTVNMWDWEMIAFLRSHDVELITPYKLEYTRIALRALALRREMKTAKFVVYQDNPGVPVITQQPEINKRFYWWEESWMNDLKEHFGITIEVRSYKELAKRAMSIADDEVDAVIEQKKINYTQLNEKQLRSAVKLYMVLREAADEDKNIKCIAVNCLNESIYIDTTPCLAYNLMYEDDDTLWACEADTMTMFTQYIVNRALKQDVMMTNIYPVLIGMAALKHERITSVPDVPNPEDTMLLVHCGYMGFAPRKMCSRWEVKPKVLAMVNDNAMVVDGDLPKGHVTLVKIHPNLKSLLTVEAELEGYAQYPGSDCRNGGIVRVKDGHRFINKLYSHHGCFVIGHKNVELKFMAQALGIVTETDD